MTIAAIVLAAGQSSRFEGGNKLLNKVGGEPMLRHVLIEASKAPVSDIVVVVATDNAEIIKAAGEGPWRVAVAANAGDGLSQSIRRGISALDPEADGALILLADMPSVSASLMATVIAAFRADGQKRITFPVGDDGRRGHPVIWPKSFFGKLAVLTDDRGGKALIEEEPANTLPVRIEGEAPFVDIDTAADLEAFRSRQA